MTLLVFGRHGQVAQALLALAQQRALPVQALGRAEIDILDAEAVVAALRAHRPSLVVNAAAYTAVDRAEQEPEKAFALNERAVANMARACAQVRVPLVHFSTDYVFDGSSTRPYRESDAPHPLGVYGRSKLAGEQALQALCPPYAIVRTSWVFSATGANFVRTMLRLGAELPELRVVADQQGCPTAAADLAVAALALAEPLRSGRFAGVLHYAGTPATSWHGFAEAIFQEAVTILGRPRPRVQAISTADYPTPAPRPAYSVLDCTAFSQLTGLDPGPWRPRLVETIRSLAQGVNP